MLGLVFGFVFGLMFRLVIGLGLVFRLVFGLMFRFVFGVGLVFRLVFEVGLVFRLVFEVGLVLGLMSRLGLELVFPCTNWLEHWYDLRLSRLGLLSELPSKIVGLDLLLNLPLLFLDQVFSCMGFRL